MTEKKILHIIPTLHSGGAERQLTNLVCNASAEFLHTVCAFTDSSFFGSEIQQAGHQVYDLGISGKHPWLAVTKKILRLMPTIKPDAIVTWLYDANIAGRFVKMLFGKTPLITTLHSADYDSETIRAGGWSPHKVNVLRQIDKWTTKTARPKFVAVSKFVKNSYIKELSIPEGRIEVIYNGIDPGGLICDRNARYQLRRELKIPENAFVFVTVGRLDILKNQKLLLQAFPRVLDKIPDAHLIIVGAGPTESELKKLSASLKIIQNVHFTGTRKDVGAFLEMSDIFVFPTLLEGFGIVLVEAMFKKLACIASDLEVIKEIITDKKNGILFTTNVIESLAEAMIHLANNPTLRDILTENAFQIANDHFHIRNNVQEWEKFLHQQIK